MSSFSNYNPFKKYGLPRPRKYVPSSQKHPSKVSIKLKMPVRSKKRVGTKLKQHQRSQATQGEVTIIKAPITKVFSKVARKNLAFGNSLAGKSGQYVANQGEQCAVVDTVASGNMNIGVLNDGYDFTNHAQALGNPSAYNTAKMAITRKRLDIMVANCETEAVYLDYYIMLAKRDVPRTEVSFGDLWTTGFTDNNQEVGSTDIIRGVNPLTTPFMNSRITKYFEIQKVVHVTLGAGGVHRLQFQDDNVSYMDVTVDDVSNYMAFKGKTWWILPIVTAQPIHSAATATTVGYGPIVLNCISTKNYEIYSMVNNIKATGRYAQGQTGIADPRTTNDQSGLVGNVISN